MNWQYKVKRFSKIIFKLFMNEYILYSTLNPPRIKTFSSLNDNNSIRRCKNQVGNIAYLKVDNNSTLNVFPSQLHFYYTLM